MRRWLLILMILFTPLRGMAADLMALAMAAQQAGAPHHALAGRTVAADATGVAHPDCQDHATAGAVPAAGADGAATVVVADDPCTTCASCMVCSASAIVVQSRVAAAGPVRQLLPQLRSALFSSAEPLPGFKPPIS